MGRYLTPAKIGLLALIELYTDAVVPTTSTIEILSFALNQILPAVFLSSQPVDSTSPDHLPFILDLKAFETLLSAHPTSGLPGRTLWDSFLKKLWDIDSLHALHEFIVRRAFLLARTREEVLRDHEVGIPPPSDDMILLGHMSPFGSFVRRAKFEFERLQFDDTLKLWKVFMAWRQETRAYWARRNGLLHKWAGDRVLKETEEESGVENAEYLALIAYGEVDLGTAEDDFVSTGDVEKLLEFQVDRIQSKYISGTYSRLR